MTPPPASRLVAEPQAGALFLDRLRIFGGGPAAPRPGALDAVHARGDRWMRAFVAFHLAVAFALAGVHGTWASTLAVAPALALLFYASAWLMPGTRTTRVVAGVVLQGFCALHIHQMHGLAEMHFFFFTAVTMMIVYQDWPAIWPGVLVIIAQHTLFAHWHNQGVHPGGMRFFEPERVDVLKMTLHYGVALLQVGVASYWAWTLRGQTLREAEQRARLEEANALLQDQQAELETANLQLQEQAAELEVQAAHLQEQTAELEETSAALQEANAGLHESNALLAEERAEAEDGRRRIAEILDSMSDAFLGLDREWRITHVNRLATRLLRRDAAALVGAVHWETWPETVGTHIEREYRRAAAEGVPVEFEVFREEVGRWIEVRAFPTPEEGLGIFFRDVTAAKAAARALQASEERFRRVVESDMVGVVFWDAAGRITGANDAFLEMVGRTRDELAGGLDWKALTPPEWEEADRRGIEELRRTGRMEAMEKEYLRADGSRVAVVVHGATFEGDRESGVALVVDVSARKRAEAERDALLASALDARAEADAARRAAEGANHAKSHFLATMSHELRTPLNAIGGYTDLMEMEIPGPLTPGQRDYLERVKRAQGHLLGLINDVLDFSKIEAGRIEFQTVEVLVEEALSEVESLIAPLAEAGGIAFSRGAKAEPGARARADVERTRQVLLNLLANALKFTEPGGAVEVGWEARDGVVEIRVRDTGRGIPADKLAAIFEPFVQVDAELTRTANGTGLGLAISRELARGMGGDLAVESTLGEGSTFTLTLPRA